MRCHCLADQTQWGMAVSSDLPERPVAVVSPDGCCGSINKENVVKLAMNWLWRLLTELSSRRFLSRLAGKLATSGLSKPLIPYFAKSYKINLDEAEHTLDAYPSLNAFFVRRLKAGARPIAGDEQTVVSPVDAVISAHGPIQEGTLLHVKGQQYQVDELLNASPRAVNYRSGYFFVLYLSPSDYHRIHSPLGGVVVEKEQIAGKVYPVNDFSMRNMRSVLSRNERVISYIQHGAGEAAVVKVGAMNVSGIHYVDPAVKELRRGDELAYFQFGSTIVLLMEKGTFSPDPALRIGQAVKMGEALGRLQKKR